MIRIRVTKRASACVNYFLRDEGLTVAERQGVWAGSACRSLGVAAGAVVEPVAMALMLDGFTAQGRNFLQRPNASVGRRCAYDVVVSASKSVSLAALCWREWGGHVRECFKASSTYLVGVMEQLARRQGKQSDRWVTGTLATAVFVHDSSRYGDPHLHSHLLTLNVTHSGNRFWALGFEGAYGLSKVLDGVFQRDLASRLREAGFDAELRDGVAVVPVDEDVCRRFSKGHQAIEAVADRLQAKLGITGSRRKALEQVLNDRIRPPKVRLAGGRAYHALLAQSCFSRVRGERRRERRDWDVAEVRRWMRSDLWGRGFGSERSRWETALRASLRHEDRPFRDFLSLAIQPALYGAGARGVGRGAGVLAKRSLEVSRRERERPVEVAVSAVRAGVGM